MTRINRRPSERRTFNMAMCIPQALIFYRSNYNHPHGAVTACLGSMRPLSRTARQQRDVRTTRWVYGAQAGLRLIPSSCP